jgi:hypothetical protein
MSNYCVLIVTNHAAYNWRWNQSRTRLMADARQVLNLTQLAGK